MNHKVLSIVFAGAKKSPLALLDGGLQTPTPKKRKVDNGAPSAPSGSNTTRSAEHLALEEGAAAEGLPKGGAADVEQLGAEHGANAGATSESDGEGGLSLSNSIPAEQTAGVEDAAVDGATFLPPGPKVGQCMSRVYPRVGQPADPEACRNSSWAACLATCLGISCLPGVMPDVP